MAVIVKWTHATEQSSNVVCLTVRAAIVPEEERDIPLKDAPPTWVFKTYSVSLPLKEQNGTHEIRID